MYRVSDNVTLGVKPFRLSVSDVAILMALILALTPLIDGLSVFNKLYFYSCSVGILFWLAMNSRYSKNALLTTLPVVILFLTNPYIGFNEYIFISVSLFIAVRFSNRFSRVSHILCGILLLSTLRNIITGNLSVYPMSDKMVLLFWNPNVYWLIVVLYVVSVMKSKILFSALIELSFLCLAISYGYSRLALIVYLIAKASFLIYRFEIISRILIMIAPIVVFVVKNLFPDIIKALDVLMSYRYSSYLNGIVRKSISDMPLLDLGYVASLVFLVSWAILAKSVSKEKLFIMPVFFVVFLLDSTIYAPLVIFWFLNVFSGGYLVNQSIRSDEAGKGLRVNSILK